MALPIASSIAEPYIFELRSGGQIDSGLSFPHFQITEGHVGVQLPDRLKSVKRHAECNRSKHKMPETRMFGAHRLKEPLPKV